jgi:hypothetical protein
MTGIHTFAVLAGSLALLGGSLPSATLAAPTDKIFTVSNYPVEARANDGVAAKSKAVSDGQKAALRSLLKRLIPVTAYGQLKKLSGINAAGLVDGLSVRSERNSSTEYIANLDFSFQPQAIRNLLEREGIPFTDTQAAQITLVPIWRASSTGALPPGYNAAQGQKAWSDAWKGLDLTHTLTPMKLEALRSDVLPETIAALANGDTAILRTFASSYGGTDRFIAAIAEPDMATKRLNVTLIGHDAVGQITWKRGYRIDAAEPSYTVELAGVVSLGVIEGRWKATAGRGGGVAATALSGITPGGDTVDGGEAVQISIEFRGMSEWQDLSRKLTNTPGVTSLDVVGLSARGARVSLRFPGGADRLADAVGRNGMALRNVNGNWSLAAQ